MPKVSVLMPAFNAESFLDESITSVLNQTFTDFELVIVDNCSTDNSLNVISKYLSDQRIKYIANEKNIGAIENFKKCLSLAKGDYIKFLCADDKFHPQLLEKYVFVMEQHPTVLLVGCIVREFGLASTVRVPPFSGLVSGKKVIYEILQNYNYLGHPSNIMIRKEALKVGTFNTKYVWLSDWELWLRVLSIGDCFLYPEELAYTRYHEGQFHKTIKGFAEYFETYDPVKSIKAENELKLNFSINIDYIIKKRAIKCSLVLPWTLLTAYKRESRQVFKKAWKVAYHEGVLFESFLLLSKKLVRKVFSNLSLDPKIRNSKTLNKLQQGAVF